MIYKDLGNIVDADLTKMEIGQNYYKESIKIREKRIFLDSIIAISREDKILVTANTYISKTGKFVYCIIWVYNDEQVGRGIGKAGGSGYHRASAALEFAIQDAGIDLDMDLGGAGHKAMLEAISSIAKQIDKEHIVIDVSG